ncbi:MAG TPA: class II aldolase/adducin family protein [Stellaceae bacterium]|nr:class II aldolase/adducin family protein [Stellaceae bacterium]
MSEIDQVRNDLVIANRVLALENVVDAYGHVSVRHPTQPNRFLLSRSRSPQLVDASDIQEFTLDGKVVGDDKRPPYLERFIHAAVYEARPEVMAVVHAHAEDILPFSISKTTRLRAVIASGSDLGHEVPIWDIREKFGDGTNLLVTNIDHGRDLARRLAGNTVCLMRGHGFAAAQTSLQEVVRTAVYLPRNARVQMAAMRLGEIDPLSFNEIEIKKTAHRPSSPEAWRAWEYWAHRAGCAELLGKPTR